MAKTSTSAIVPKRKKPIFKSKQPFVANEVYFPRGGNVQKPRVEPTLKSSSTTTEDFLFNKIVHSKNDAFESSKLKKVKPKIKSKLPPDEVAMEDIAMDDYSTRINPFVSH